MGLTLSLLTCFFLNKVTEYLRIIITDRRYPMPLIMANAGEIVKIFRITGSDAVRQYLSELGFVPGETITVISKNGGNLILQVKDGRIAIDRSMSSRVMVA